MSEINNLPKFYHIQTRRRANYPQSKKKKGCNMVKAENKMENRKKKWENQ